MSSISHDCPHCGAKQSSFLLRQKYKDQTTMGAWSTLVECGVCKEICLCNLVDVEVLSRKTNEYSPRQYGDERSIGERYKIIRFEPEPPKPQIADGIPASVEVPLREAEVSFSAGLYSASGACYRKSMERALRVLDSDGKGMLNARIRSLEENGLLPHAMISLLDRVKLFGNSSMHDDEDPTKEDCETAREFAHLFLTYAFSLPKKIEAAKQRVGTTPNQ